jgi:hypothetical protein
VAKGYRNETCAQAIKAAIKPREVLTFSELFGRVKRRGAWRDSTIWQHLMSLVVNLPPARCQWKSAKPFLFVRGDGRYELYDEALHPRVRS